MAVGLSLMVTSSIKWNFYNSLQNDWHKLKTIADNKVNVAKMIIFRDRIENTVGKAENAGYQKAVSSGLLKVWFIWEKVNLYFAINFLYTSQNWQHFKL